MALKQVVPTLGLDTSDLPVDQRLASWAETIPSYEVTQADEAEAFLVRSQAWLIDAIVASLTYLTAIRMSRSQERILADGMDDLSIILNVTGDWTCQTNDAVVKVPKGVVCLLYNALPFVVSTKTATFIIVVVPRHAVDAALLDDSVHGLVLDRTLGLLLADYLRALIDRLPGLAMDDAASVAQAMRDLLNGCLASASRSTFARSPSPALLRAQRFINSNLSTPLSVRQLGRELGLSRSQLYRVFAQVGGVERFILRRRLSRVHAALRDAADRRTIAAIAHGYGFASSAHFSRLFKAEFGYTPKDLKTSLRQPVHSPSPRGNVALTYQTWTGISAEAAR